MIHSNCDFHNSNSFYKYSPDPRKDCSICQSVADSNGSISITNGHVYGKWCKKSNQCRSCCKIKHLLRILKHYGEICSPKKCPVCDWAKDPYQSHNAVIYESQRPRLKVIIRLYRLMLTRG